MRNVKLGFAAAGVGVSAVVEALDLPREEDSLVTTFSSMSTSMSSSSSSLSMIVGRFFEPRESASLPLLLLLLLRLALLLGRFSTSGDSEPIVTARSLLGGALTVRRMERWPEAAEEVRWTVVEAGTATPRVVRDRAVMWSFGFAAL